MPPGDYALEDGRTLVIGEGGLVSSIGEPSEEEVEASEEVEVEIEVEAEEEPGYVTKAEVEEMIKAALESINDKEEMSVNPEAPKEAKEEVEEEVVDEVAVELAAVKAQLEDMKKQAAEAGLKHKAPTVKREPINLKNLSTQERVSALLNLFSKQ